MTNSYAQKGYTLDLRIRKQIIKLLCYVAYSCVCCQWMCAMQKDSPSYNRHGWLRVQHQWPSWHKRGHTRNLLTLRNAFVKVQDIIIAGDSQIHQLWNSTTTSESIWNLIQVNTSIMLCKNTTQQTNADLIFFYGTACQTHARTRALTHKHTAPPPQPPNPHPSLASNNFCYTTDFF